MTKLTLLPEDILHALLTHISHHKATLRNLALVHPRFVPLTPIYLLKTLHLSIRHDDETFSQTFQLLLRTISEAPKLASLIQNLKLYWYSSWDPNLENEILANDLLSHLHNLRSLTFLAGGPGELYMPLTFLDANPMVHLHTLTISDSETTLSDIFTYITSLPSLQNLHINSINFSTLPPPPIVLPPSAHQSAALQTLHLNTFHLPPSTLHALLLLPGALQTLHCLIPGHQLREPLGGGFPNSEMLEPLSAANVALSLHPARESLVELCVLANAGEDRWPGRCAGERLDLRDFGKLEVLRVASELVFASGKPDRERKGLYKLLPSSLEVLDLDFGFDSGFLYLGSEEWTIFSSNERQYAEQEKWKYTWLQELAEHAASSLPKLRKVTLKERWKHPQGFAHVPFRWVLPAHLDELFRNSGVEVEVWLRRPRDYGNFDER